MSIERTTRRRIHLIKRAELLKRIAEGCLCDGIDAPEPLSLPHAVKCATKFYGLAANEYRAAGDLPPLNVTTFRERISGGANQGRPRVFLAARKPGMSRCRESLPPCMNRMCLGLKASARP